MHRRLPLIMALFLFTAARPYPPAAADPTDAGNWLQFDGNGGGRKPLSIITQSNVKHLEVAWRTAIPELADGAPVFVSGVIARDEVRNVLVVSTMYGRLIAIDASTGRRLWMTTPPAGPRWTTSSPAVDPTRTYVFGYTLDGYIHRYDLSTGEEVTGPGWPALITLKGDVEKGSSSISIATARNKRTYLYMTIAAYPEPGDDGDYQGHLVAIDLESGQQHVFNALCSDHDRHFSAAGDDTDCSKVQAGIWARAGAVYDSVTDRVFVTTGNGPFTARDGGYDWGTSVVALRPDGSTDGGTPLDSYTPVEYQRLTDEDLDLSSTAIEPIPTASKTWPRLGVQSGKDGKLRLLNLNDLSGERRPRNIGGELQVLDLPQGQAVMTQPAAWLDGKRSWVFVANNHGTAAFELIAAEERHPQLVLRWSNSLRGTTPVISNRVLYLAAPHRLTALRPTTGAILWHDDTIGDIHWQSPIIVHDTVYLSDNGGYITAYSLSSGSR